MSKFKIFKTFLLKNPWIWVLCIANIFVYIVRIGVDNWSPLYVTEHLNFSHTAGAGTIFYFEVGALLGSVLRGYLSDLVKGRPALVSTVCCILLPLGVLGYQYGESELTIFFSLFIIGLLVFGPQLLIGVSLLGFVPKKATTVVGGLQGGVANLFGDSTAKILLAQISDPQAGGITVFSHTLHGWQDTFVIFYIAIAITIVLLGSVAVVEERNRRR